MDFVQAGQPLALFMFGNVVGSILIGNSIDKTKKIVPILIVLFMIRLILILLLSPKFSRYLGFELLLANFFIIGIISGGIIPVVLKCVRKVYSAKFMGTGASLSMTLAGILTVVLLPIVGLGMDYFAEPNFKETESINSLGDASFYFLVAFLTIVSLFGILGALAISRKSPTMDYFNLGDYHE